MMGTLQLSPNDPPDQNMVNTGGGGGGGGGSVAKNGTFVTSVVGIRNNVNHADKTQNVYWTTVIEQGRAVVSWQEITTLTRSYSQWLYPTYRPWSQAHCSKTTTPDTHRARIMDAYLQQQHITRIDWPACSPDINPIEHVWDQLGRAAQARLNVNSTRADLRRFLVEEWDRLTQDNVQLLVHSMRRRCAACIAARGGPIHY